MYLRMAKRVLFETDKRLVWKFMMNMGIGGIRSVQKYKKRKKQGIHFPPFLYISIINSCNLRCQGCWVDVAAKQTKIDLEAMNKLIGDAKKAGNRFFGILGGEPFMHPEVVEIFKSNPDCYFQVFTNGHFITDEVAKELRKAGNVTPLISVEGNEIISNERRGKDDVYNQTMEGIQNCLNNKLLTGVCTSLCQTNFDDLLTNEWVDRLIEMGVFYLWYHTYRPVGPDPVPELALTMEQQRKVREFVVNTRATKPIAVIDAYYDGQGKALCPAATGISHHINASGDIEPCPVIQFAKESIYDDRGIYETMTESPFLKDFRETVASQTRGCVILERPDLLEDLVERHGAEDATIRKTALAELEAADHYRSQWDPENEVPERSFVYRILKKFFYSDFGTYDGHDLVAPMIPSKDEKPPKDSSGRQQLPVV